MADYIPKDEADWAVLGTDTASPYIHILEPDTPGNASEFDLEFTAGSQIMAQDEADPRATGAAVDARVGERTGHRRQAELLQPVARELLCNQRMLRIRPAIRALFLEGKPLEFLPGYVT